MDFARAFRELKFNPNHDPNSGEFSDGGAAGDGGGGKTATTPKIVGSNVFADIDDKGAFKAWVASELTQQGVPDWEAKQPNGYDSQFFTHMRWGYFGVSGGGNNSDAINAYLRGGMAAVSSYPKFTEQYGKDQLAELSEGIDKYGLQIHAGAEVYRGVQGDWAAALDKLKPGDEFQDKAFLSTTPVVGSALGFTGAESDSALMQVRVTRGQKALPATFMGESELLFKPGQRLKFLRKYETTFDSGLKRKVYQFDLQ